MTKRILLTGGAGFIGSALARRLHDEGHQVRVLDDFSRGNVDRLPKGVDLRSGDVRDRAWVAHAAAGCDVIFHLAYVQGTQTFYERPRTVVDVALKGIMNVLDAAAGKELFLVSSSEVYQSPGPEYFPTSENVPLSVPDVTNPRYSYGAGKIACEVAALAYADVLARTVIVRPHNVYGADAGHEHVIPQLAERMQSIMLGDASSFCELPIQGTGQETRCFNYIDDAIDGLMILLDKGEDRNVYHLGTDEEVTIERLAQLIGHACGLKVRVLPSETPKGSPPRRRPDISKLRTLGYEPKVALAEGLKPTLRWYAEHPAIAA